HRVAVGDDSGMVRLFSLEDGPEAKALRPPDRMPGDYSFTPAIAFSPAAPIAALTSYDKTIRIWSLEKGEIGDTIAREYYRSEGLVVTSDGLSLITGSESGAIRIVNADDHTEREVKVTVENRAVNVLARSPDGARIAFATSDSESASDTLANSDG